MDLEVEAKESADQWKASFDVTGKFIGIFHSSSVLSSYSN
jgi:hypothetical protein